MLIPRFSLRLILLLNVAFALVFLTATFAVRGQSWALAILVGLGSVVAVMATFGCMFAVAFMLSTIAQFRKRTKAQSPFATDTLPPQVVTPRDEISN